MTFEKDKFLKDGFIVLPKFYKITPEHVSVANKIMVDNSYKAGKRYLTHNISHIPHQLRNLIFSKQISDFFGLIEKRTIFCKDIMLTYDFKNIKERNQWLHFDRWRSLKAMVYLTDVDASSGPFSIVPESQKEGAELRRKFNNLPYEKRPNRIEIDFPDLYIEPQKILGKAGTLILFDSDTFHKGGDISKNKERKLIRSHWYIDRRWQEIV